MQGALKRLQILMGDTIQILDHMSRSNLDQILQHIKNGLNEENTKLQSLQITPLRNRWIKLFP